ncbi:hypothetical protein HYX09_04650, partial [Candidatus Woesearchaeota archaeon]|nr:hypothetical protein [Candidatus Woesearchaeota archaeon]
MKLKTGFGIAAMLLLLSVPSAYGQVESLSFLGDWQWFAVNAMIIFAALFVLQAVLMPGKPDKEKTVSWMMVLAASLVISWFVSSSGFIWEHPTIGRIFEPHMVVNTILITAFTYLALGLLKVGLPQSGPGKVATWLMIGVISFMASVRIGESYVWQLETLQRFVQFLFGAQGILTFNENRIIVFAVATALFIWTFALLHVSDNQPKINYALALILGASLAGSEDPVSINFLVMFGHVIGMIAIGKNLAQQATGGRMKFAAYAFAFLLLWWVINAAAPGYGIGGSFGTLFFEGKGVSEGGLSGPIKLGVYLLEILLWIVMAVVSLKLVNRAFGEAGGGEEVVEADAGEEDTDEETADETQERQSAEGAALPDDTAGEVAPA